jgi:hypothetical protein
VIGRTYLLRGERVVVVRRWKGRGPRNVLIRRADGSLVVRPFRGLRRPPVVIGLRGSHARPLAAQRGRAPAAPGLVAPTRELRNAPWRHADDLGDDPLWQAGGEGAKDRPVALADQALAFDLELGQPAAVGGGEALERGQRPGVAPAAGTDHTPVVRCDTAAVLPRLRFAHTLSMMCLDAKQNGRRPRGGGPAHGHEKEVSREHEPR